MLQATGSACQSSACVHLPAAASSMSDPGSMSPADLSELAKAFRISENEAAGFWASACHVLEGSREATEEAQQVYLMWAETGRLPKAEFEDNFYAAQDEFMSGFASTLDGYLENMPEELRLRILDGHDSAAAALELDLTNAQASTPTRSAALATYKLTLVTLPFPDMRSWEFPSSASSP